MYLLLLHDVFDLYTWTSVKVVYQIFKHPKWLTFLFKNKKYVTFWVMKYSSGKKFYCTILLLKNLTKNKEQVCKKWTSLQKKWTSLQKKWTSLQKNYMGILKRMCALLICSLWKVKNLTHRHHIHIFHKAVSQSNVKKRVKNSSIFFVISLFCCSLFHQIPCLYILLY